MKPGVKSKLSSRQRTGQVAGTSGQQGPLSLAPHRLVLMRHAKSAWGFEGMEDVDRPLNKRGQKSAVAVAQELVYERRCLPSLVLSSTAKRTQQTWEYMCQGVPELCDLSEVFFLPELYGIFDRPATPVLMDFVHAYCTAQEGALGDEPLYGGGEMTTMEDEAPRTILCLGHNEGWQMALHELLGKPAGTLDMKTADCFVLTPKQTGKGKGKGKGKDFDWGDIYSSYGKWQVEHHIRAREVLDKAVKPFFQL